MIFHLIDDQNEIRFSSHNKQDVYIYQNKMAQDCRLIDDVKFQALTTPVSEFVQLRELPLGEYFRIGEQKVIYVRGEYCRSTKKFSVYKFHDINAERFLKGSTLVTTNTGDF